MTTEELAEKVLEILRSHDGALATTRIGELCQSLVPPPPRKMRPVPEPEPEPEPAPPQLADLGVAESLVEALEEAGFTTVEQVATATAEELQVAEGVGPVKAEELIEKALGLLDQE